MQEVDRGKKGPGITETTNEGIQALGELALLGLETLCFYKAVFLFLTLFISIHTWFAWVSKLNSEIPFLTS